MSDDDEEQPKTRFVRIGYATTDDGQIDAERIGTVEQLPYGEAKTLVKAGRGQYVDGPDPDGGADVVAEPALAKPRGGGRWGDGGGQAPARPGPKTGQADQAEQIEQTEKGA